MDYKPQKQRLSTLIEASAYTTFINDIFDAAQRKADMDDEEMACKILDHGHEILFELKRIELLSSVRDEIMTDKLTND